MRPRILLVDDEAPARSRIRMLLADIGQECPHELVGEAGNAQQALDALASGRPDVVLLDVQMPGVNGIELAAHIARLPDAPAIVFVTAYDEYALKAFEVHAIDYLLKPVRAHRLAEAVQRAAAVRAAVAGKLAHAIAGLQPERRHFSVQERGRVVLVPVAEVLYCKAELKYVTLRTGAQEFLVEESLASIEDEFGARFLRIHRNALVAREAIAGVERSAQTADGDEGERGDKAQESWQVVLRGIDERLPISRRQWSAVRALLR